MPSLWKPQNGSHRDLEISPRTRDFHIPTAEAYNFLNGKEEEENKKNDGRNGGRRSTIIASRSPHAWWPVLTCPSVAGFEVSTEAHMHIVVADVNQGVGF